MIRRLLAIMLAMAMIAVPLGAAADNHDDNQDDGCVYFDATGYYVCGGFLRYWETYGGLAIFGYPISNEVVEDGITVQYFERARVEWQPGTWPERWDTHLGLLGNAYAAERGLLGTEPFQPAAPCYEGKAAYGGVADDGYDNGDNGDDYDNGDNGDDNDYDNGDNGDDDDNDNDNDNGDNGDNGYGDGDKDGKDDHNGRADCVFFEETGHNLSGGFLRYWEHYGGLAIFGYPISEEFVEDGLVVQYFERQRFEWHPGGWPERWDVMLGLLGVELYGLQPGPEPEPEPVPFTVVAEGLDNPRHLAVDSSGEVYVVEAGAGGDNCVTFTDPEFGESEYCVGPTGGVTRVSDGEEVLSGLPSLADATGEFAIGAHATTFDDEGVPYILTGEGAPPEIPDLGAEFTEGFWQLARVEEDGSLTPIFDLNAFEAENNPDGEEVYSNPYDVIADGDKFIVVDAGANSLIEVDAEGNGSVLAVFEPRLVDAPPFLELPEGEQIPMQSVPTSVTIGPDGAYYVGELTGFPFPVGAARVYRIVPGEEPTIYAEGFTNILDVDFDDEGNLYVVEIASAGLLVAEQGGDATGALIKVAPDGTRTTLASEGLTMSTGVVVGGDGAVYVSNFGIFPDMGQVVRVEQ